MEDKIEYLASVLGSIQRCSQPVDGHTDPKSLIDCWKTVWEIIEELKVGEQTDDQKPTNFSTQDNEFSVERFTYAGCGLKVLKTWVDAQLKNGNQSFTTEIEWGWYNDISDINIIINGNRKEFPRNKECNTRRCKSCNFWASSRKIVR